MDVRKPLDVFPLDLKHALELLSLEQFKKEWCDTVSVAGSAANALYPFFNDLDGLQEVFFAHPSDFKEALQHVVRRLISTRNFSFVEFKAGMDPRLVLMHPQCWIEDMKVHNWDLKMSLKCIQTAVEKKLCTAQEALDWVDAFQGAGQHPTPKQFVLVEDIDPWKVRWSAADILKGFVVLRGGRRLPMEVALAQPARIKMDATFWSESQQRFLDISMIYVPTFPAALELDFASLDPPPELSIKQDIFSQFVLNNFLKLAKRLLSLAVMLKKDEDALKLRDIVVSDAGRAAQIASDCTTLDTVLETFDEVPPTKVDAEIQSILFRVSSVWGLELKEENKVTKACKAALACDTKTKDGISSLQKHLETIQESLEPWYSAQAMKALRENAYIPLPAWALP